MTGAFTLFDRLPGDSNIWIHVASRELSESEAEKLATVVRRFSAEWTSHERPVRSDWTVIDNQILLLAAYVPDGDLSGCGIDKHEHILDVIASTSGFEWVGPLSITYRDTGGQIQVATRAAFKHIVLSEGLPDSTLVLDRSLADLRTARRGVEIPAKSSWHGNHFPFLAAATDVIVD